MPIWGGGVILNQPLEVRAGKPIRGGDESGRIRVGQFGRQVLSVTTIGKELSKTHTAAAN